MRIVYMGTPDFAVPSLEELHRRGHDISWVVTQPDAVRDRGKKVKFPPVKEKALELGLKVLQPEKLKANSEFEEALREARPDVIAVAAYGKLLPEEILSIPKEGCINVHASLLPRFRGAAPIQRAIMEGDEETGVTIMYMEKGMDTGDMLAKKSTPIGRKTAAQLHDQLADMGGVLLADTLEKLRDIEAEKQNEEEATYAPMISKEEGHIDFSKGPEAIERMIRAFDPWPGAYAFLGERQIKFWRADPLEEKTSEADGTVTGTDREGLYVASGGRLLKVTEIQVPGRKRVEIKEFLKGNSIEIGSVLR
ncbi:MAG TPA: methionyl-tRNA formyltransferase [Candidatus Copromorpha excrementigallinarum]|uniref:Methionyl-tRNA formyltransferase n=1 Tax=Candidatus Allocopromorpha excrementigallinarum TaxID=2840742 RepID=A0A9D1I266_9FIRM|nr:methionyl-tRNA formyltransferase [Candidatus Copromorpha excrementigallinarum]